MVKAENWASRFKKWPAIYGNPPFRTVLHLKQGFRIQAGLIDVIERTLLVTGEWDPLVERVLKQYLKPGDTFLDVGANIGYFSLFAASIVGPDGKVLAVEPSLRALGRLEANISLNGFLNITVIPVAAGVDQGLATLSLATPNNIGASSLRPGLQSVGKEVAAITTLDEVIAFSSCTPALIKIDVEGGELNALLGLRKTLEKHHPAIVAEMTPSFLADYGQNTSELLEYMKGFSYSAYQIALFPADKSKVHLEPLTSCPIEQSEVLFLKDRVDAA